MEVLKRNIIVYKCPVCESIIKLTGEELEYNYFRYNRVAKCPVCNTYTWLFEVNTGNPNPEVQIRRMTENEYRRYKKEN